MYGVCDIPGKFCGEKDEIYYKSAKECHLIEVT
jgi:hypothetical protein